MAKAVSPFLSQRDLLGLDPQASLELDMDVVQQVYQQAQRLSTVPSELQRTALVAQFQHALPLLHRFASYSRGPFAVIRHVGRRSGKPYETTIMIWPMGDGFVIALTYGPEVDWYRNLRASGHGTLLWRGR